MAPPFIPPWLNIDPIEPVRLGMQARAQRNQREAAELNAQIAREKMQQDALQTAAALAARQEQDVAANELKRQELEQLTAYRAEEGQRKRAESEPLERLRQQKYEQDALEASQRLEGTQEYQKRIAAGEKPMDAFAATAHKLLYKDPKAIGSYLEKQGPLTEQTTEGGAAYLGRPGGRPYFVPRSAIPEEAWTPGGLLNLGQGLTGVQTGPKRLQLVDKPTALGGLTDVERSRISGMARRETYLQNILAKRDPEDIETVPALKKFQTELDELRERAEGIRTKAEKRREKPAAAATTGKPLPTARADWVTGETYNTAYGPMEWNGTDFVRPDEE